jgi:multicomponent Na+:H+ antiporter subunit D
VLLPLIAAAASAALRQNRAAQRRISVAAMLLLGIAAAALLAEVASKGVLASQMGDWPVPFGITLVADRLSAAMIAITALLYAATVVYAEGDPEVQQNAPLWHPLLAALVAGVCGAFLAGDLFNLYVWFEVMLIASFGLLVLGGGAARLDGGVKYAVLNLLATTVFLIATGILHGLTGTLNLADMAARLRVIAGSGGGGAVSAAGFLLMASFAAKAAAFPLFFWLPASYHTASMPVAAIFAGLLTKVGVYAILRLASLVFAGLLPWFPLAMGVVAAATMVTGVLGAAAHWDIRRILSFHIVSQIGYMLVGAAIGTKLALGGAVLYVIHHIVVKANLFLAAGAIRRSGGSFQLAHLGGLWRRDPILGLLFAVPALSLAGMPPLSGFWAKLLVVQSGFAGGATWLAAVALGTGLLTLYSMLKIWTEAFWKEPPAGTGEPALPRGRERLLLLGPIGLLGGVTLVIGIFTEPFAAYALAAGDQLAGHQTYVAAVLGARAAAP